MSREKNMLRYSGEDYYVHPIAVAKILLDNTDASDTVIATALMHDCIEDVPGCTYETVKKLFNGKAEIADAVLTLSKEKDKDYDEPANMNAYLGAISKNKTCALVKIADRINNNSTMDNRTEADKAAKTKETKEYYLDLVYKVMPTDEQNRVFYKMAEEFFGQEIV